MIYFAITHPGYPVSEESILEIMEKWKLICSGSCPCFRFGFRLRIKDRFYLVQSGIKRRERASKCPFRGAFRALFRVLFRSLWYRCCCCCCHSRFQCCHRLSYLALEAFVVSRHNRLWNLHFGMRRAEPGITAHTSKLIRTPTDPGSLVCRRCMFEARQFLDPASRSSR